MAWGLSCFGVYEEYHLSQKSARKEASGMRSKSLTKDERKIQIIQWFRIRIMTDNYSTASLAQIAQGLGLSPSSHLRAICESLVEDQIILAVELRRKGRWKGRGYIPNPDCFERPHRQLIFNYTLKGETHREVTIL